MAESRGGHDDELRRQRLVQADPVGTYYYIFQTFFDSGDVFARLKGGHILVAAKVWRVLCTYRPRGLRGLIRMVSEKQPHEYLPTIEELEKGHLDESGAFIVYKTPGICIGLPLPRGDFAARLWLHREWNRFRKLRERFRTTPLGLDEAEYQLVRLNRRFRKARDAILAGFGAEATEHPEDPGAGVFIPTPLQEAILQALNGKALKKEDLADDVKIDPSRLYRPGALQELRKSGKVEHKRGIGYYRPDAPPPNTLELKPSPNGHQDAPKLPPSAPN